MDCTGVGVAWRMNRRVLMMISDIRECGVVCLCRKPLNKKEALQLLSDESLDKDADVEFTHY